MKRLMGWIVSLALLAGLLAGSVALAENSGADTTEDAPVEAAAWPRTYMDALGRAVVIEKQPERVISLMHVQFPDVMLSLGVVPVGVASADSVLNAWSAFAESVKDKNIPDIASPRALNLEFILELEPDIILAAAGVHDVQLDAFEAISTVVYLDQERGITDQAYSVREIATVLGKEDEGERVLKAVQDKVVEAKAALAAFMKTRETVLFFMPGEKTFYLYEEKIVPFDKNAGLGLNLPENYPGGGSITLEGLAELNPDHIFVLTWSVSEWQEGALKEYEQSAVWNSISAVKNGHVYAHDASPFAQNAPIATMYGIDYVVNTLTGVNEASR